MRWLIALFLAFLVFGCIGGGPPPTPINETEGNKTVVVVTEPQKNVTIVTNKTEGQPPEENVTEIVTGTNYTYDPSGKLGIYFIDMCDYSSGEHGAAILIKKGDFDMVVDAGSSATYGRVVDFLRSKGVDDIDVLVSTTGDLRRYGGIAQATASYVIEEFWWGGVPFSQDYTTAVQTISAKAKNTTIVRQGYSREFNGISFEVLNPKAQYFDDVNNDAIVLRISDRNSTVLLLSNVQTGGQGELVNKMGDKIRVDIIEAPYYGVGAGTAMIGLFLQASKPQYAVIEGCSDETQEVEGSTRSPFRRLMEQEQYKVTYYETYKDGTVKVTIDETGYGITIEK